jgi:hypothetical protein
MCRSISELLMKKGSGTPAKRMTLTIGETKARSVPTT